MSAPLPTTPPRAAARGLPRALDQRVEIETPEQVIVSYEIAGVGSRAAAALIDYAICAASLLALFVLGSLATRPFRGAVARDLTAPWIIALLIAAQFALVWGYYVLFEGLRDGQTPGKRRMGLRVVQDGGYSVTFGVSAVRNIVRALDMQPAVFYVVGMVSAALSSKGRRLGDIVAGTIVVRERVAQRPRGAPAGPGSSGPSAGGGASPPPARAILLTEEEFALLDRYVARQSTLDADRRSRLTAQLAARFRARATDVADVARADGAFLLELFERERQARARGAASASDTGAPREQYAIVAEGAERWAAFATLLADAQRRGLRSMTEEEVSAFVARYRELAADLARLRTATRGRDSDALFYLSRLVAGGHNLLYRRRAPGLRPAVRFMASAVPAEVRRSWRPIALAAALLFVPAAMSFEAVRRHPDLAPQLVPAELIDRAETGVVRAQRGERGFLPEEMARFRGPVLASAITTNNVQVTYVAFALGITAGVGTALALIFNGVAALGAPLGLYVSKGIADQILGFVAPHGVLELAAICIAGGGGLLLASAILLPGARTRGEALVDEGRRAIRLIAASTFLLVIAGLLEGNVSPLPWPNEWKYLVSAGTAVFLAMYLSLGRNRESGVGSQDRTSREPSAERREPPFTAPPSP